MKYIIMCGGFYQNFKIPKQLSVINGERVVDRTIRLLKENGIKDIYISSNNPIFDSCGVPRLEHHNSYKYEDNQIKGYWLDAFYPYLDMICEEDEPKVCYIFGDVYFTEEAIKTIINYESDGNILFGNSVAKNEAHRNIGEPFAYKVNNYKEFIDGINAVKKLQDEGKTIRVALVWELYRYLNNLDVNIQQVLDDTYICIDDGTIDIDSPEQIERLNKRFSDETR